MTATRSITPHSSLNEGVHVPIHELRGEKVILDSDLARIYGVTTIRFNQAVKRNARRFPLDFCFQCTSDEWERVQFLRSQNVILKTGSGKHRKYRPYVFTEHGAVMAANVLRSPRAIEMSVFVIRAFVRMRGVLHAHKELEGKIAELERRMSGHDAQLRGLFDAIRQLMQPAAPPKRPMGFRIEESGRPKNSTRRKK